MIIEPNQIIYKLGWICSLTQLSTQAISFLLRIELKQVYQAYNLTIAYLTITKQKLIVMVWVTL